MAITSCSQPLVSIIIPTCRRPQTLCRAIDSVIKQTYHNIEIIVVDDNGLGTLDQKSTSLQLQDYFKLDNFHYVPLQKNSGQVKARNIGITVAQGDFIGFLDDDDEFLSTKIELQVYRLLEKDDSYGACYCLQSLFWNNKDHVDNCSTEEGDLTVDILTFKNHLNTSSLLFKRDVLLKLGGFDETLSYDEDWDLVLHLFYDGFLMALADSSHALLRRYESDVIFTKKGIELIKTREQSLLKFRLYINRTSNPKYIYKTQWQLVYKQLFRQNFRWLGLKIAFRANHYVSLSISEWKWVFARLIKG